MFINVDGSYVEFRTLHLPDENECTETVNHLDLKNQGYETSPLYMDVLRRIYKGEKFWFMHPITVNPPFLQEHATHNQIGCVSYLESTYRATQHEIMNAITFDGLDHSWAQQNQVNFELKRLFLGLRSSTPWGHMQKALTLAWLCNCKEVANFAWPQAMSYNAEQAKRLEPDLEFNDSPSFMTHEWLKTQHAVGTFIAHVNVACSVALDTPQLLTLNINDHFLLEFKNVRIGPHIRGLRITLPTGGVVFYRDAQLIDGGRFTYLDQQGHKQVSSRKTVVNKILEQATRDLQWTYWYDWHGLLDGSRPIDALQSWMDFSDAASSA